MDSNITKDMVLDFISKVKGKAVGFINDKYQSEVNKEKVKLLLNADVNARIRNIEKLANLINLDLQQLERYAENVGAKSISSWRTNFEELSNKISCFEDVKSKYLNGYTNDEIKDIKTEWQTKKDEIKVAYNEIECKIVRMRSVPKMIAYLNELGFDTKPLDSWKPKAKVSKEVLFPCKQEESDK